MSSRLGCDQSGSQGHQFGIKAKCDVPAFRDRAELGPGPGGSKTREDRRTIGTAAVVWLQLTEA